MGASHLFPEGHGIAGQTFSGMGHCTGFISFGMEGHFVGQILSGIGGHFAGQIFSDIGGHCTGFISFGMAGHFAGQIFSGIGGQYTCFASFWADGHFVGQHLSYLGGHWADDTSSGSSRQTSSSGITVSIGWIQGQGPVGICVFPIDIWSTGIWSTLAGPEPRGISGRITVPGTMDISNSMSGPQWPSPTPEKASGKLCFV